MDLKFQYDLAAIKFPERLAKNLKFARVIALTRTALDVRKDAVQKMKDVFDRPTKWTLSSLKVVPATKAEPIAYVDEKGGIYDAADHILGPHLAGTGRGKRVTEHRLGSYVVPGKEMKLNAYGNLPQATYIKIAKAVSQSASDSQPSRPKGKTYFKQGNVIYERTGKYKKANKRRAGIPAPIKPALILARPPILRKTFPYFETGQETFDRVFPTHFNPAVERAIQAAVRNSGFR